MDSLTLTLKRPDRPGGVKRSTVTWNGNVQVVRYKDRYEPRYEFMFEMDPDERAERLAELGQIHK